MSSKTKQKVVIVGGGFAGASCAVSLEKYLGDPSVEIHLINPTNYFIFYPLLMEAGTGSLQPDHAVVALRSYLKKTQFHLASLTQLDVSQKTILCHVTGTQDRLDFQYDHLILAMGSRPHLPEIPGLKDNGLTLKSLADAATLRDRVVHFLELADMCDDPAVRAELLHFVVVGGSFNGVEIAGELREFLHLAAKRYRRVQFSECRVTLIEKGPSLVAPLGPRLSAYAKDKMQQRGIDIHLGRSVEQVGEASIQLDNGQKLSCRSVIWCAAIGPTPVQADLNLPVNTRGFLDCTADLRLRGHDAIWAIGDCAAIPDGTGRSYPPTAQHAVQEGRHLALNISRVLHSKTPLPCKVNYRGSIAQLGYRCGVASLLGFRISGFFAWWLWHTLYLMKMPGWGRRLRIAADWTLGLLTRRDIVCLRPSTRLGPRLRL